MLKARLLSGLTLAVVVLSVGLHAISAPGSPAPLDAPAVQGPIGELVRNLVLKEIPQEYEDTKRWGGTKRVWDGLKIERDGLRIKTKRRWKEARHGTWKRYKVWLMNPEEEFQIRLENVRQTPSQRVAFDLVVDAHVGAFGRLSEFRHDVQLISLSANAEAVVRMRLGCELSAEFGFDDDASPQVALKPEVTQADLQLIDFELHRLSQIHGDVAEELGESLHDLLQKEIDERRGKIVAKANRAIAKNEDDLRLSLQDVISSGWEKVTDRLKKS